MPGRQSKWVQMSRLLLTPQTEPTRKAFFTSFSVGSSQFRWCHLLSSWAPCCKGKWHQGLCDSVLQVLLFLAWWRWEKGWFRHNNSFLFNSVTFSVSFLASCFCAILVLQTSAYLLTVFQKKPLHQLICRFNSSM